MGMSVEVAGQTPINTSNVGGPTNITPYYFGPNAFPVPEILDGTEVALRGEMWSDYSRGHLTSDPDQAADLGFKLVVPFWTGASICRFGASSASGIGTRRRCARSAGWIRRSL